MKRVVIVIWKTKGNQIEVFSSLKNLSDSYPVYNYNTLNNYLSKKGIPFENSEVRVERKTVHTVPIPRREIVMVAKQVPMRGHNEEEQNLEFWLSRPVHERLEAVTRLSSQLKKYPDQRLDKSIHKKIRLK
jgi:hypothetical protein